jgi:hypothetical protein
MQLTDRVGIITGVLYRPTLRRPPVGHELRQAVVQLLGRNSDVTWTATVPQIAEAIDTVLREHEEKDTPAGVQPSGATSTPSAPARTEGDTNPPPFFQPGRTYRRARTEFQCVALSVHPTLGGARAIGWLLHQGYDPRTTELDTNDYARGDWQETSQGGEPGC